MSCKHLVSVMVMCVLTIFLGGISWAKSNVEEAQLSNKDCIKCHPKIVMQVQKHGSKHKTAVGCLDCHEVHPPMYPKEEAIPKCSKCHTGKSHYELPNCLGCHQNPHEPLNIVFKGKLVKECLTCHTKEEQQLKAHPSAHTNLGCNDCHDKHGFIPQCSKCHEPHSKEMTNKDCLMCHPPHQPLVITYKKDTPNSFCAPCHGELVSTLANNKTKHHNLACVYCHRNTHGIIPKCETCHGSPHPASMLAKYPKCINCHNDAHALVK